MTPEDSKRMLEKLDKIIELLTIIRTEDDCCCEDEGCDCGDKCQCESK